MQAALLTFTFLLVMPSRAPDTGAAEPALPLPIAEIAPCVFFADGEAALADSKNLGGISNAGFITSKDGVADIGTGGSFAIGMCLKTAIRVRANLPIRHVINPHAPGSHFRQRRVH